MAYVLFLLANAALFIRPAELSPSLSGLQLYLFAIAGAIVCAAPGLHNQIRRHTMRQQPINFCVAAMVVAVVFSHLSRGAVEQAALGGYMMAKVVLYYLLLVSVINTPQRLKRFLFCTAICSTAMIALSLNDYHSFVQEWSGRDDIQEIKTRERWLPEEEPRLLRHIPDLVGYDGDGRPEWVFRLCGLGIFHDPNDLSLLIAVTAIIAGSFMLDRRLGPLRWGWLAPLALMGVAYYFTYSRGGLLALGFGGMVWLAVRFGGRVAVALGVLGVAAVPIALGRHAAISVSSGTGQHRIHAWSDGLVQLKSSRLFFGIGEGVYQDVAGIVAHNSYIHAFVELGLFGGSIFFGSFFFAGYVFFRIVKDKLPIEHAELSRMLPYIASILAAWSMGMASLSRCYVPPTYMVIGVCAAYINLLGYHRVRPAPLITLNWMSGQRWALCSVVLLICCFLFVKTFARYG